MKDLGFVFVEMRSERKQGVIKAGFSLALQVFNKDEELAKLEQEVRQKKIRFMVATKSIAPWDFREEEIN